MTSLSLLLYAADVVPSFGTSLAIIGWLGIAAYLAVTFGVAVARDMSNSPKPWFHGVWWPLCACVAAILLSSLTPSKTTILLIAGAEAGATYVASDAGAEMVARIDQAIKAQLDALTAEAIE